MPNPNVPAAASGLPSLNRRSFVRGLGTATVVSGVAANIATLARAASAAEHPDALLIALGAEFDRRHAGVMQNKADMAPLSEAFDAELDRRRATRDVPWAEWCQIRVDTGFEAAIEREHEAFLRTDEIADKIRSTPAQTFAGLAVKLKITGYDCCFSTRFHEPEDDMEFDVLRFWQLLKEVERMAAIV